MNLLNSCLVDGRVKSVIRTRALSDYKVDQKPNWGLYMPYVFVYVSVYVFYLTRLRVSTFFDLFAGYGSTAHPNTSKLFVGHTRLGLIQSFPDK